ncbi:MAG: hypothetical protein KJN93_09905 [Alphaproteobacteria bacterium]|nr:hypothetical protein [Alphaproteobacteria bacterium]NNF23606.1 hypothetical protein [Paracoccaceae bacterium]
MDRAIQSDGRLRHVASALFLAALCGCATFPELDRAVPTSALEAPYPSLVPLDDGFPELRRAVRLGQAGEASLAARIARLRARAALLRAAG